MCRQKASSLELGAFLCLNKSLVSVKCLNKGFSGGSKLLHITVFNDELGMLKETIIVSGSHVTKKSV